jgi:DNA-binding transcriptional LysR family regulator
MATSHTIVLHRTPISNTSDNMSDEEINIFLGRTTLRQIEILSALSEYRSFTKAAEALGMSVANVSRASKRFESNLNLRLFEGDGRRFVLRADASDIFECLSGLTEQIALLRRELDSGRALSSRSSAQISGQ